MLPVCMVLQLCKRPEEDQLWVQADAPCFGLERGSKNVHHAGNCS